jgi:negative regulator of flagellin synthesis FlgM
MRVSQPGSSPVTSSEADGPKKAKNAAATAAAQAEAAKKSEKAAAAAEGAVKADISTKGKEMAQAKAVATSAPDVREQKIQELKRRISSGEYNVSPEKVADKMVDEHLKSGIG